MTEVWLDDVMAYSGIAAVDVYLGATQLRHNDPANMNYPGDFSFGGGHVIEKLVAGEEIQLFALSYGTDEYPLKELRTYITINDLNQAIMTNPRKLLPELQRCHKLFRQTHSHLPRQAESEYEEPDLQLCGSAFAPA